MAWTVMTQEFPNTGEGNQMVLEYTEELAAPGNGADVIVPAGVAAVTCALKVTAGSGKVQWTPSPLAAVKAGTANWYDWPLGVVVADASDSFVSAVKAFRVVNVSGTVLLEATAQ